MLLNQKGFKFLLAYVSPHLVKLNTGKVCPSPVLEPLSQDTEVIDLNPQMNSTVQKQQEALWLCWTIFKRLWVYFEDFCHRYCHHWLAKGSPGTYAAGVCVLCVRGGLGGRNQGLDAQGLWVDFQPYPHLSFSRMSHMPRQVCPVAVFPLSAPPLQRGVLVHTGQLDQLGSDNWKRSVGEFQWWCWNCCWGLGWSVLLHWLWLLAYKGLRNKWESS